MRFTQLLVPLSFLKPTLCLAVPSASEWVDHVSQPAVPVGKDSQLLALHGESDKRGYLSVLSTAIDIGSAVVDVISDIEDDLGTTEANFVSGAVNTLRDQFPDKNVLVYHDPDSGYDLYGAQHVHKEVDLNTWFDNTQGYEVWVFDHGSFDLAGDGGFSNWGFSGCYKRNGNHVDFYSSPC